MNKINVDNIRNLARLQEIADLDLFSENLKSLVDDLTVKASEHLKVPNCAVTIVLDEAQFFLALHGPRSEGVEESEGTPLEWSFCQYVVKNEVAFVVPDATKHAKMKDSPLVTVEGVHCYAGVPLISSKGYVLGAFCAYGYEGREFSTEDLDFLRKMATIAVRRIEARVWKEILKPK